MAQNDRRTLEVQERNELVPLTKGGGSYSFVSPRRSRKETAVIVVPPLELEFKDDVPTRDIRPVPARGTGELPSLQETVERMIAVCEDAVEETRRTRRFTPAGLKAIVPPEPVRAAYRDPDLCTCDRMMAALQAKAVMVVVAGPVSLAPAALDEDTLLSGQVSLASVERAYDGKPWAFRHCPFEGRLIDDQVEILQQTDRMSCCGTMALAVEHGRVALPDPERFDRTSARFTQAGRAAIHFSHCPWCATEIIDLAIARHKRHRGL